MLQLTAQIEELRQENEILKEEGAVGGSSSSTYHHTRPIPQSQQLAKELMIAASTAETNLRLVGFGCGRSCSVLHSIISNNKISLSFHRQLLNGVENLRLMARKIDTIDDGLPRNDYSDCDDDDFAGPAL